MKWELNFHDETEEQKEHYEITNGVVSLCVNIEDIPEKNGDYELDQWQIMDYIKNILNDANLKWYLKNPV